MDCAKSRPLVRSQALDPSTLRSTGYRRPLRQSEEVLPVYGGTRHDLPGSTFRWLGRALKRANVFLQSQESPRHADTAHLASSRSRSLRQGIVRLLRYTVADLAS